MPSTDVRTIITEALTANRYNEDLGTDGVAEVATIALDALTAAGYVLLPPGGEVAERFKVSYLAFNGGITETGEGAEVEAREALKAAAELDWPSAHMLLRREIRIWPDGSQWFGPWTAVEEGDGRD